MARIAAFIKATFKYWPFLWGGIKALWALRQARKKQEKFHDALIKEADRRAKAEAEVDLTGNLAQPISKRRARIRALAARISRKRHDLSDND